MIEMMTAAGRPPMAKGNIKKFDAGEKGIVALSDSGRLYSIGDMYLSGTGAATTTWGLLTPGVENFWMSYRTLLVKMLDGRWLCLGANNIFPTSLGSQFTALTDVSAYMGYTAGLTVKDISMGLRSLAVVFTNGQYAMCGQNTAGGLGLGNTVGVRTLTMRTDYTTVKKIVIDWSIGDSSVMLLNNGDVYAAGESTYGWAGSVSSSVSTWTKQGSVAGTIDIVAGSAGWYRIVETSTAYFIYVQGRHFDGSLGTGVTAATNYTNPTIVNPSITDKSKGPPVIYVGLYSARFNHPVGSVYYTGTASGSLQGSGLTTTQQTTKYSFTALPAATLAGEYHAVRGTYTAAYLLINGVLYGTGQDNGGGLLPGLGTTRSVLFVPLDTTPII